MTEKIERDLLRGSLDLMVLSVLANEDQYGYLIQKKIDHASRGQVKMSAGTLYPLLHRLEADRLIRSRWESVGGRRRKWYGLTAKGKRRLQRQAQQWTRYVDCLTKLLQPVLGRSTDPA